MHRKLMKPKKYATKNKVKYVLVFINILSKLLF